MHVLVNILAALGRRLERISTSPPRLEQVDRDRNELLVHKLPVFVLESKTFSIWPRKKSADFIMCIHNNFDIFFCETEV